MNKIAKKHIAVLMGGWNSEKEVSVVSGNAVYNALIELGYKVTKINFDRNIVSRLQEIKPDIVFNALHGRYGEDGRIQGLLDILNIPYTHSGLAASAICMDKVISRNICSSAGIKVPTFVVINKNDDPQRKKNLLNKIGKPFVIKPVNEGSSVGVEIILEHNDFDIENYSWQHGDQIIAENYIKGQEIHVAIIDDKAVGAIEVKPKKNLFYDYQSKYTAGMTEYIMPALITSEKYNQVLELGLKCHQILGCKTVSRVDFLLNNGQASSDNQFYLLEVNTHPGLTPTSLVPKIAKYNNISFNDIVEILINSAQCGL